MTRHPRSCSDPGVCLPKKPVIEEMASGRGRSFGERQPFSREGFGFRESALISQQVGGVSNYCSDFRMFIAARFFQDRTSPRHCCFCLRQPAQFLQDLA